MQKFRSVIPAPLPFRSGGTGNDMKGPLSGPNLRQSKLVSSKSTPNLFILVTPSEPQTSGDITSWDMHLPPSRISRRLAFGGNSELLKLYNCLDYCSVDKYQLIKVSPLSLYAIEQVEWVMDDQNSARFRRQRDSRSAGACQMCTNSQPIRRVTCPLYSASTNKPSVANVAREVAQCPHMLLASEATVAKLIRPGWALMHPP